MQTPGQDPMIAGVAMQVLQVLAHLAYTSPCGWLGCAVLTTVPRLQCPKHEGTAACTSHSTTKFLPWQAHAPVSAETCCGTVQGWPAW